MKRTLKRGDLVLSAHDKVLGIVLTTPRVYMETQWVASRPVESYYLVDVYMPWGIESFATDELKVINANP